MAKKGLVFLHFIWSKKLTKIFKWKSVCKGGRGREYILADKLIVDAPLAFIFIAYWQ